MKTILQFLLIFVLMVGCKTYNEQDKQYFDQKIQSYIKKNKLKMEKTDSGLYYKIIEEGEGNPILFTDEVSFTYTGKFMNGDVFDKVTKPVKFQVKQLIGAWKEIMLSLKPGAKAYLIAPPQLGYGDKQLDDIPANSILIFEMKVIKVE